MELPFQPTPPAIDDEEGVFECGKDQFTVYNLTEHQQARNFSTQLPQDKPKLSLKVGGEQPTNVTRSRPFRRISLDAQAPLQHFSKNFECGNLQSARMIEQGVYRLRISNDCNSRRQSQWFYFSCRGIRKATFVIGGFVKSDSLYNYGMKVCIQENGQWFRGGQNISYEQDEECGGYCLKFAYRFKSPSSKTYFAYCFPYTYGDLQNFLQEVQRRKHGYCTAESICKSLLKNQLQCLTIADGKCTNNRELIIITGRVHPGETVASFIMQGFLNGLLGDSKQAQMLRQRYIFKVVPMLNPDGVVMGNYRLSYSGSDLNRKWRDTSSKLHPEVYALKKYIQRLNKQCKIRLMVDMHGHSRKKGVFFYGCQGRSENTRQFPYIMSQVHPSYHYQSCCFAMPKSKEGTLRLAMYNYLKLPFIYTLESSFCGNEGTNENYTMADFQRIGAGLVEGMFVYFSDEIAAVSKENTSLTTTPSGASANSLLAEGLARKDQFLKELTNSKQLMEVGNQDDSGSESAPSEGCYREDELLKLIKLDPFLPPGNNKLLKKDRGSDPELVFRPSTTQRKGFQKVNVQQQSQLQTPQISPDCKVRLINGQLFDRLNRSKALKQADQQKHLRADSQDNPKRTHPTVVIIQSGKDVQLLNLAASRKDLDRGAQYKRVKKYAAEQMMNRNSRKRASFDRSNDQLHPSADVSTLATAPVNRAVLRERKTTASVCDQEPKLLKINEAKLHMNIFTPSFVSRQSASISYESERRNSSLSGFNRSIRAKDYLEEKRVTQNRRQSSFNRKAHMREPLDF